MQRRPRVPQRIIAKHKQFLFKNIKLRCVCHSINILPLLQHHNSIMKPKNIFSLLAILFFSFSGFTQTKVISYNIRYNNPNDAENCWENRKEEIVKMIDFYHPQFLGIQEGLKDQIDFLNENLVDYSYIGVGRDDGKEKGEFAAIFFDTTMFQLLEAKTFWLSETPEKVSVGWDASMERITTCGAFMDKESGNPIFIFNSHFDHIGELSRKKSAKLILKKIEEFGLNDCRVIVMGDLNCEQKDKPIRILRHELDDAMEISENPFFGPVGTYNGFYTDSIATKRIDYIFTKNVKVLNYSHIGDRRKNNLHLSDHFPVFMEISDNIANSAICPV